jgi:hypothetical protein
MVGALAGGRQVEPIDPFYTQMENIPRFSSSELSLIYRLSGRCPAGPCGETTTSIREGGRKPNIKDSISIRVAVSCTRPSGIVDSPSVRNPPLSFTRKRGSRQAPSRFTRDHAALLM